MPSSSFVFGNFYVALSLVFVVARFLVFVPSSALRLTVLFGIFSVFRILCALFLFGIASVVRVRGVLSLSFVFEGGVRISYRAVRKIALVYVRCCVRSFVLVCPCVMVRSVVSSFVFFFVSAFACERSVSVFIVPSWPYFVRSACVIRPFLDTRHVRYAFSVIVFVLSLRWYFVLVYRADESF